MRNDALTGNMTMTDQYAQIIEREFRRVLNDHECSIVVTFTDDECIHVDVDCERYTMQCGSDDDRFVFVCDTQTPVIFEIPADWPTE